MTSEGDRGRGSIKDQVAIETKTKKGQVKKRKGTVFSSEPGSSLFQDKGSNEDALEVEAPGSILV